MQPPQAIRGLLAGDMFSKFKQQNGIKDQIDPSSDLGRQILYKLKLGLGLSQNPIIQSIHQISPFMNKTVGKTQDTNLSTTLQQNRELLLESWVSKEEISKPLELMSKNKGFDLSINNPKQFTVGKRLDLSNELNNLEFPKTLPLYLYQIDVGLSFCYPEKVTKEEAIQIKLPQNYNSVFVHLKDFHNDNQIQQGVSTYSRNYMIYEGSRITPLFKVSIKVLNKLPMPFQMARNEVKICEECKKQATIYCKNEDLFFCNQCDYNWHNIDSQSPRFEEQNFSDHIRYDLIELESLADNFQKDYGQEAMCALCIVDYQEKHSPKNEHQIMELSTAYDAALRQLKRKNDEVQQKQQLIREQMQQVIDHMRSLKQNSDDIEERLYQLLQETLSLLKVKFQEKSNILKNDFSELQRQENEMKYIEEFMLRQAHDSDPVQFLQIWDAYQINLRHVASQRIELTEVPIDLKLEQKPVIITTGGGISKEQLQQSQGQVQSSDIKASLLGKVKLSITKHLAPTNPQIEIKTTKEEFTEKSYMTGKQSIENKNNQQLTKKEKRKLLKEKIDNLYSKLTEQIASKIGQENGLMSRSNNDLSILQKSIFGVFQKQYPQLISSDSQSRFISKLFKGSQILSDINKSLIYFNLPFDPILKDKHLPVQLFPPPNSDVKLPQISQVVDFFERKKAFLMPNLILMHVDLRGQKVVIGGYSSHGWVRDSQVTQIVNGMDLMMRNGGDETSFMFNLTHNLRFETTRVKENSGGEIPIYTSTFQHFGMNDSDSDNYEDQSQNLISDDEYEEDGEILNKIRMKTKKLNKKSKSSQNSFQLRFGDTDLLIGDDFKSVTSIIDGHYFSLNGEFMSKSKIDSIIPNISEFTPIAVEIWTFPNIK
eukprot:403343594